MKRTVNLFHRAISLCVSIAFLATGSAAPASVVERQDEALAPASDLKEVASAIRHLEERKHGSERKGTTAHVIGDLGHFTQGQVAYLYRKYIAKAQRPDPQQLSRLSKDNNHLRDLVGAQNKFEIVFADLGKDMYFQNKEGAKASALTYEKPDGRRVVLISKAYWDRANDQVKQDVLLHEYLETILYEHYKGAGRDENELRKMVHAKAVYAESGQRILLDLELLGPDYAQYIAEGTQEALKKIDSHDLSGPERSSLKALAIRAGDVAADMVRRHTQVAQAASATVFASPPLRWWEIPVFEASDYCKKFIPQTAGDRVADISKNQVNQPPDIQELRLGRGGVSVSIQVDKRLVEQGLIPERIAQILEASYKHLSDKEKRLFKKTVTSRPYVMGLIPRADNQWQSQNLFEHHPDATEQAGYFGVNEYLFQADTSDALLGAWMMQAILREHRPQDLEDTVNEKDEKLFRALGEEGSLSDAVRQWRRKVESDRYNINQAEADLFIESDKEQFQFISSDKEEMSPVYRELKEIVDRLLTARGYDPSNFHFHLADYSDGNAFVVRFANHIVINVGLLWQFVEALMSEGKEATPQKLLEFYKEDIAFVLAHEISHLKQYRDKINRGEAPAPETVESMRAKMKKGAYEILKDEFKEKADVYAHEVDADSYALQIMDKAGFSVRRAHRPFELMMAWKSKRNKTENMFGDHPLLRVRVKNIKRQVRRRYFKAFGAPLETFGASPQPQNSPFFDAFMRWSASGKSYVFKRTRVREYHGRLMSVGSLEELLRTIRSATSLKELEMASTYGMYSLLYAMGDNYFSQTNRRPVKMLSKLRRKIDGLCATRAKNLVGLFFDKFEKERSADVTVETSYGERVFPYAPLEMDPRISNTVRAIFSVLGFRNYITGGEHSPQSDHKVFLKWLVGYAINGRDLTLQSHGIGLGSFKEAMDDSSLQRVRAESELLNEDLVPVSHELSGVLNAILHDLNVDGVMAAVREEIEKKSRDLDRSMAQSQSPKEKIINQIHGHYTAGAIQGFYGPPDALPQKLRDFQFDASRKNLFHAMQALPRADFLSLVDELTASMWVDDFTREAQVAAQRMKFLNGQKREDLYAEMAADLLVSFRGVLETREQEFTFPELLELANKMVKFVALLKNKYNASRATLKTHGCLNVIVQRMQHEPSQVTQENLSSLLTLWMQLADVSRVNISRDEARFFADTFILNPNHYERFKPEILRLVQKGFSDKEIPLPSGGIYAARNLGEFLLISLSSGALDSHPAFGVTQQTPQRAAEVYWEIDHLFDGFNLFYEERGTKLRKEFMEVLEAKYQLNSPADKLRFYEAVLQKSMSVGKNTLYQSPYTYRPAPLNHYLFKKMQGKVQDENYQTESIVRLSQSLGLGPEFIQHLPERNAEVKELMYLFGMGGLISIEKFHEYIAQKVSTWTVDDVKALTIFLKALGPLQSKRNLVAGRPFLPDTWEKYLAGLSLFLIRKEFDFKPGTDFQNIDLQDPTVNPYTALLGDLFWKPLSYGLNEEPPPVKDAYFSIKKSPKRSTDRFHFLRIPKEEVLKILGFVDQNPQHDFEYWVHYAEAFMPPSVTRNIFLYYVLWQKKIAPGAKLHGQESLDRFYDWFFTAKTYAQGVLSKDPGLKEAVLKITPLMVEDQTMKKINAAGAGEMVKELSYVRGGGRVGGFFSFLGILVGGAATSAFYYAFRFALRMLDSLKPRMPRLATALTGLLTRYIAKLGKKQYDREDRQIFLQIIAGMDEPHHVILMLDGYYAIAKLNLYTRLRQFRSVRFFLTITLSFIARLERVPRTPWEFNEPGNVDSQIDLMVAYPYREGLLKQIHAEETSWEASLKEIEAFFPRSSPVRDEFIVALAHRIVASVELPKDQRLSALETLCGKMFHPFFRERFALQALELALAMREESTGQKITFEDEKTLVFRYFPTFSFTRDDLLFELMEKARIPQQYRDLSDNILQFQENVTQEDMRNKMFAQDKIREQVQSASNADKAEFALWIMGLRKNKPFAAHEIEYLYRMDLGFMRDVFNQVSSRRYTTVGSSFKKDLMESLFGGPDGLASDPNEFERFLDAIFEQSIPQDMNDRRKMKKVFLIMFRNLGEAKKLEVLGALAAKMRPGQKAEPGELIQTLFKSLGLVGIKLAQIISHSDMGQNLDPQVRKALEELSKSSDPLGKKDVFQFLELVFGDDFEKHFLGVGDQLGSASIKVVYEMLLRGDYEAVLKLKKPEIDKVIEEELTILENTLRDLGAAGIRIPKGLGQQVRRYVMEEIDFNIERANQAQFMQMQQSRPPVNLMLGNRRVQFRSARGLAELDGLLPEALRNSAMFEEKIKGIDLNDTERLQHEIGLSEVEIAQLKKMVFDELLTQIFVDGVFHADPHGGNILARRSNGGADLEVVFLDLGSMGRVKDKRQLAQWLMQMAMNGGRAPSIPDTMVLEATFFKKVGYLVHGMRRLEGINEFYIAKEIFQRLGLEFPSDTDPSRQIAAVDLLARGKWDRISMRDFSLTPKDKMMGMALGLMRWIKKSGNRLQVAETLDESSEAQDMASAAA